MNEELRRFGEATGIRPNPLGVRPISSVLAITVGGLLIVPAIVSPYRTASRIKHAQVLSGTEERLNPGLALLLYLCGLFFVPVECVYAQRHVNAVWAHERREAEKASLGMRGPVPAPPPGFSPVSRSRPLAVNLAAVVAAAAVIAAALAIAISTAEGGRQAPDAVNVPSKRDQAVQHFYGVLVHVKSYYHWKRSYSGLSRRTLKLRGPYEFRGVTAATFCVQRMWSASHGGLSTLRPRPC